MTRQARENTIKRGYQGMASSVFFLKLFNFRLELDVGTKSTLNTKKAIHRLLWSRWSLAAGRDKGEDYRE